MRIGILARQAGLRASAIRYYETLGLLPRAARTSGRREYGSAALNRLRLIQAAQRAGFSLRETRGLLALLNDGARGSQRWRELARAKLDELGATIASLESARDALAAAVDCACGGSAERCTLVVRAQAAAPVGSRRRPSRRRLATDD
jgi:MerR family redox-sensitive transcriptional activator SoxR